jgi:hypothetical protein
MCDEIKFKMYRMSFGETTNGGQIIIIKVIEEKSFRFSSNFPHHLKGFWEVFSRQVLQDAINNSSLFHITNKKSNQPSMGLLFFFTFFFYFHLTANTYFSINLQLSFRYPFSYFFFFLWHFLPYLGTRGGRRVHLGFHEGFTLNDTLRMLMTNWDDFHSDANFKGS